MRPPVITFSLAALSFAVALHAQTSCAVRYTAPGAFICYPNPSVDPADEDVPEFLHLSAQANAPEGGAIRGYVVEIDGRQIYRNQLDAPVERLSVEINLRAGYSAGAHALRVVFDGAGVAESPRLRFHEAAGGFCDPFVRFDLHSCSTLSNKARLRWLLDSGAGTPTQSAADPLAAFVNLTALYTSNLKSIEADIGDAMAVDARGTLYVAQHVNAEIELRKYASDGSLMYDNLVRSCGSGFLSITGLSVDDRGRAWITGSTTGCLPTTPDALAGRANGNSGPHGFLVLIDTSKGGSEPVYATYLSTVGCRPSALRVDQEGNAYVTGTADSSEYPHDAVLNIAGEGRPSRYGFVSVVNPGGSGLRWSTLLPGAQLNGIALDGAGGVYVTGRVASARTRVAGVAGDEVLIAGLSDSGRRLSYAATFGGTGENEGRSISTTGKWILVTGATQSPDFLTHQGGVTSGRGRQQTFALALQPCDAGAVYAELLAGTTDYGLELAVVPALEAFASLQPRLQALPADQRHRPAGAVRSAPKCDESKASR